jgi:hypothetical protein
VNRRNICERVNESRSCVLFLGLIIAVLCVACAPDTDTPTSTPKVPAPTLDVSSPTAEAPKSTPDALTQQVQEAIHLLHITNGDTCWEAARKLGQIGPEAVPPLIQTLEDENTNARRAAAYALGEVGPEAMAAVPALVQALDDEDHLVRQITAEALGKIGPRAVVAVPALIQTLTDEDSAVRWSSTYALGNIGPGAVDAVPALIQVLEHQESPSMREAFSYALKAITGQNLGKNADAWQQWWEKQQKQPVRPTEGTSSIHSFAVTVKRGGGEMVLHAVESRRANPRCT